MGLGISLRKAILFLGVNLLLAGVGFCAEDWVPQPIGPFSGLNDRDNSFAIGAGQAQSLLNVELTPSGKSVRKRRGYGVQATLAVTTSPVHGIYTFFDSNGNAVDLYFNDDRMTSSVGGSSPTLLFSTGPLAATYQCTDSLGFAYCANTSRTTITKTNGATYSSITSVVSTGTMVAACPTRLAMAGFAEAPSRIDLSADGDLTSWGSGSLGTSPVQFTINSPGARITHIVYAFGRLMWFKNKSFGYILIGNQPLQTDWQIVTVAYDVGTNDNTSVYREGNLYFRGDDSHIYVFDGSNYQRLSREISGTIAQSQGKSSNAWTQTTQADWQLGVSSPIGNLNTSLSAGSVVPSTAGSVQTLTADFTGTFDKMVLSTDSIRMANSQNINFGEDIGLVQDWSFENNTTTATDSTGRWNFGLGNSLQGWIHRTSGVHFTCSGSDTILSARSGSNYVQFADTISAYSVYFQIRDTNNNVVAASSISFASSNCNYNQATISIPSAYAGKALKFYFTRSPGYFAGTGVLESSYFVASGNSVVFYWLSGESFPSGNNIYRIQVDDVVGGVTWSTGTYTSATYDIGVGTSIVATEADWTVNKSTPVILTQTSDTGSSWVTLGNSTGTTYTGKRYVRFVSSVTMTETQTVGQDAFTTVDNVRLIAVSTGSFLSQVKNAPNLTSWDAVSFTKQDAASAMSFYIRSSTGFFPANSSTYPWTSLTDGSIPTVSTAPYFQIRVDFSLTKATQVVSLDAFTVNWFEGAAADKSYATYFNDSLWWSVASGAGATTNNKCLIYDLLNQTWLIHDIASNGFLTRQTNLYFGSASGGYVYKFGTTDNDNGSAINAYWKSKDFFGGQSPFTNDELKNISFVGKSVSNSSMTVTYTLNGSSSTAYTMNMTDPKGGSFRFFNKNLPTGSNGSAYNIQFGNNAADQPFEIFGIQVGIIPRPWIPSNQ